MKVIKYMSSGQIEKEVLQQVICSSTSFFVQFIFIFAYRKEYVFIPLYVFTRSTVALPVGNAAIGMLTYMRVV